MSSEVVVRDDFSSEVEVLLVLLSSLRFELFALVVKAGLCDARQLSQTKISRSNPLG